MGTSVTKVGNALRLSAVHSSLDIEGTLWKEAMIETIHHA
jgi:hypothetical protein